MKNLFRPQYHGRSGYIALIVFLFAYTATLALVIAPDRVKSVVDTTLIWPLR